MKAGNVGYMKAGHKADVQRKKKTKYRKQARKKNQKKKEWMYERKKGTK